MAEHSFLPPSGAAAWTRCAMWPTMNRLYLQSDSPESIEGTAAHWVAWECLQEHAIKAGQTIASAGGVIVSEEMIDGGDLLCDVIGERLNIADVHIEERVEIPQIHADCFGTPDVWGINRETNVLHIIDYKFGHRYIDEYFNPQGLLYLLGILYKINNTHWEINKNLEVEFTIVQPRCFYRGAPVRSHKFKVYEAFDLFEQFEEAADEAFSGNPTARTIDSCNDCPGRHACPALQEAAYSDAEFANNRQPHNLSPNAAALELRMLERALERLGARVDGLRELTLANMRAGKSIPYYRLDTSKPRRTWNVEHSSIITMGQMFGKDLSKPGVITPLQASKLGVDEGVINAYSFVPTGSLKLVPENPGDARKVFSNE